MNYLPTKTEHLLAARKLSFASPASLPLHFRLGDREIWGIPEDFHPQVVENTIDATVRQTLIIGQRDGLQIRAEVLTYRDFPCSEYTVYFTNRGSEPTPILHDIHALDKEFCGEAPVLHHGNGDNITPGGYDFWDTPVQGEGITVAPADDGTSCNGGYPFLRLVFDDSVLTTIIGWSGSWKASFVPTPLGVQITAGQKLAHFTILPGETMRTPRICMLISESNSQTRACNQWRRFYAAHVMPRYWGKPMEPKLCSHVWCYKKTEFCAATEDNQIEGLRRYIHRGMKPDIWWMDAGWYPCVDDTWSTVGTWHEDEARWPSNGLGGLGRECAEQGVDFLCWFEPERVSEGSEIDREHPEFLLRLPGSPTSLFDLGNDVARDWLIERVDSLIKKWKIAIYRQDFNMPPAPWWRHNEAPDRLGALENKHIQGYYQYWDALLLRNPGLLIDSCASGGRRNDLETMRRALPLHFSDMGIWEPTMKARQHLMLFEWTPYFRSHIFADEGGMRDYHWFCNLAPAVSFMTSAWGPECEYEVARAMRPIWYRAAELELRGDYYPQCRQIGGEEGKRMYCIHFYDSEKGDGFVFFLRFARCEEASFTASLALEEEARYRVEDPVSGKTYEAMGCELNRFTAQLDPKQGKLFFLTRLNESSSRKEI